MAISLRLGLLDLDTSLGKPGVVQPVSPDSSPAAHQPHNSWLGCLHHPPARGRRPLTREPPTSAVPQPIIFSEQPIQEENKTSPLPLSQLIVSFSVWGATNSGTYNFKRALLPCPEPLAALQLCSGKVVPTQPVCQPRQEKSQCIPVPRQMEERVGLALEFGVGGSVLSLRLPGRALLAVFRGGEHPPHHSADPSCMVTATALRDK